MSAVEYLEALQRQFSTMLRTPLDRTKAKLASTETYPAELANRVRGRDPRERLAIYNRQYWFRLFGVLQTDFKLTTALAGAATFNDLAAGYLLAHPPEGHQLSTIGDAFPTFLAGEVPPSGLVTPRGTVPAAAVIEAAKIDAAFHAATHAPIEPRLVLGPADAPKLPTARLVWARSFTLVEESWPLFALRRELPVDLGEHQATLPTRHAVPHAMVVHGTPSGVRFAPTSPLHAELLRLLHSHAIGDSLAMLEARHGDAVVANAQRWFAEGIQHGYWTRLEVAP